MGTRVHGCPIPTKSPGNSASQDKAPSSIQFILDEIDVTYLDFGSDVEESKVSGHEMVGDASSLILSNGVRCCSQF